MKKIILAAAIVCAAAITQAATVGWSHAGLNNCAGNSYYVFVVGQNGVSGIATITALLNAGEDFSSYVFGSGNVAANGTATTLPGNSGKTIAENGVYTAFTVIFDGVDPVSGESKYLLVSGGANQTKEIGSNTPSITFVAGNISALANDASNWASYGNIPEPTSAMLLVLGVAALALRRRQK